MAIWQVDCLIIPKERSTEYDPNDEDTLFSWSHLAFTEAMIDQIRAILPEEKSWSKSIRQFGKLDETCIELIYTDDQLVEIGCRIDLRNLEKEIVNDLIGLINCFNAELFYNHRIYQAEEAQLIDLLRGSDAYRFCKDPIEFFEKLRTKSEELDGEQDGI